MSDEKQDYFFLVLDDYLKSGWTPKDAIIEAVEDYQFVFDIKAQIKRKSWIVRKFKKLCLKLRNK
jgi:hypothetical protein